MILKPFKTPETLSFEPILDVFPREVSAAEAAITEFINKPATVQDEKSGAQKKRESKVAAFQEILENKGLGLERIAAEMSILLQGGEPAVKGRILSELMKAHQVMPKEEFERETPVININIANGDGQGNLMSILQPGR